jgi:hypothetical protein
MRVSKAIPCNFPAPRRFTGVLPTRTRPSLFVG